jgi:hypothetical protein
MDDRPLSGEEGRIEQLLLAAGYGTQLADDTVEISGTGIRAVSPVSPPVKAAGNDQPTPFFAGATRAAPQVHVRRARRSVRCARSARRSARVE